MTLEELIRRLRDLYDINIKEVGVERDYVLYSVQYNGDDVIVEICYERFNDRWKYFKQNASEIEVEGIKLDNNSKEITISVTQLNTGEYLGD